MATLGQLITMRMRQRNLTVPDLADLTGLSKAHISSLKNDHERVRTGFPRLDNLKVLSEVLDIPMEDLIEAAAETVGYPLTRPQPLAARTIAVTPGVEDLTPEQIGDLANMARAFAAINAQAGGTKRPPRQKRTNG